MRYSTIGITGYAPLHHDGIIYSTPLRDRRFVDSLLEGDGFELLLRGIVPARNRKFADSPLEGSGFELVWGFSLSSGVFRFIASSLFGGVSR